MSLDVALVSPERILFNGEADMVVCRTADGEIAFLSDHTPFVGALAIAPVRVVLSGGNETKAAVHGGFVEVRDNKVSVLSDVAELADQIDVDRARRAKEAAERRVAETNDELAEVALRRALVRLDVAGASGR